MLSNYQYLIGAAVIYEIHVRFINALTKKTLKVNRTNRKQNKLAENILSREELWK